MSSFTNLLFIAICALLLYFAKKLYDRYQKRNLFSKLKSCEFQPRIVIIGAGFSGLCTAIDLVRKLNYSNFVIYEKESEVGGTWHINRYPGCGCDIPAKLYSLSFALNPKWTMDFPLRSETLRYMIDLCKQYNLYKNIRFNTTITGMEYNANTHLWTISAIKDNIPQKIIANMVITCVGILNAPKIPNSLLKMGAISKFKNDSFHSSKFSENYDWKNKTMAVIGTGPTAIQIVPELAKTSKKLYVFQRSASHLLKKPNFPITPFYQNLFHYMPWLQRLGRWSFYWYCFVVLYQVISPNTIIQKLALKWYMHDRDSLLKSDEIKQKVTPKCYVGLKRILLSNTYYPCLEQENVDLITDPIVGFTGKSIVCNTNKNLINKSDRLESDGRMEYEVDCIVYATGFKTLEFLCSLENGVIGLNGKCLQKDVWNTNDAFAHLGITVSGFPNLFIIYGPGTNLGTNSVLFMIECASNYVVQLIKEMMINGYSSANVNHEIQSKFVKRLDKQHDSLVWSKLGNNWYKNDKGRVPTNWAWSTVYYWWLTRKPKLQEFGFTKFKIKK